METRRPDSELLALIEKIADKASVHAMVLEQTDEVLEGSCNEYEMAMEDLRDAFYCLNRDDEWCHMTEVWRWLTYRENEIVTCYEEF